MTLNKKLTNLALIGFALMPVTIPMAVLTPSAIAQSQQPVAPLLQEVLPQLRQMTQLPILLPSELPPTTEQLYKVPGQTSKAWLEGMMRMANSAIKAGSR